MNDFTGIAFIFPQATAYSLLIHSLINFFKFSLFIVISLSIQSILSFFEIDNSFSILLYLVIPGVTICIILLGKSFI